MSGHLIGCAGDLKSIPGLVDDDGRPVPIPKSHKSALLAFADSADNITHIGFAGYAGVQKWAVCSRGRAAESIRDLVEWRLLKPHKRGYRGQRAEYVVFPDGCCDLHRKPVDEPGAPDVEQTRRSRRRQRRPGPDDALRDGRWHPSDARRTRGRSTRPSTGERVRRPGRSERD
ncbi:hypothetical protein G5V59_00325 [Nocardioides sp. W3-2-3]|uniref:hypothetical protein n=1 Tax=Nocardioides convexus TaxID=2712224 RepID=UPI002418AC4B|nr:hypothetical protein [Nocardioides convexus]NGZ99416.1 hypothetical protein [Nocardioides convexus]